MPKISDCKSCVFFNFLRSGDTPSLSSAMLMPDTYNEKKVLQLLAQGSKFAFTQLFDHYRGRIFSVAWRFLKARALAEEIVQEVFLNIWVRRDYDPETVTAGIYGGNYMPQRVVNGGLTLSFLKSRKMKKTILRLIRLSEMNRNEKLIQNPLY